MSHHSKAQLIKFTDQQSGWESLKQFTDQMKKAKKVWESWKWTFYKGQYLKPSSVNLASVSKHVKKKKLWNLLTQLIQFTDLQLKLKKQQTVEKNLSVSVLKYLPI